MPLYPSQEWCDTWKDALNNDPVVAETGKDWGVGFKGDFVFEITPGAGLEETRYLYLGAEAGKCTEARYQEGPLELEPGFFVSGSYGDFKPVIKGEKDFVEGIVRGVFTLKGDMSKIMRNAKFIRAVSNSISSFENDYLGE